MEGEEAHSEENGCVYLNCQVLSQSLSKVRHILDLSAPDGGNGLNAAERGQYQSDNCDNGEDGEPGQNAFDGILVISGSVNQLEIQVGQDISSFPLDSNEIVLIRCIGGNGGNGGNGRYEFMEGSSRGKAGNGGGGGNAGDVVICTEIPTLLAAIELENRGGQGGFPGVSGRHSGSGQNGPSGTYGAPGHNGSVSYNIKSSSETVLEAGVSKFAAKILSMRFLDKAGNGVFEPGSDLIITDLLIINDGDLALPAGARLAIQIWESAPPVHVTLPGLSSRQQYNLVRPIRLPLPVSYTGQLLVTATVTLANRLAGPKAHLCTHILLQHPIRVKDIHIPHALGPGEHAVIRITLENVSSCSYGRDHRGRIDVELQLCRVLNHSGKTSPSSSRTSAQQKLSPSAIVTQVFVIESRSVESVEFSIKVADKDVDTIQQLYAAMPIQIQLFLNGQSAELILKEIRCIPNPCINPPLIHPDILLITSSSFSHLNYTFWRGVASKLGLSLLTYNVDRDTPEHSAAPDYLRRCPLIIAASSNYGDLLRFPSHFISQHLLSSPSSALLITGLYDDNSITAFLIGFNYSTPVDNMKCSSWNLPLAEERLAKKAIKRLQALDKEFRYYAVIREIDGERDSSSSCCGLRCQLPTLSIYRSLFPTSLRLATMPMEEIAAIRKQDCNDPSRCEPSEIFSSIPVKEKELHALFERSTIALLQFLTLDERMALLLIDDDRRSSSKEALRTPQCESKGWETVSVADLACISIAHSLWKTTASACHSEANLLETIESISDRFSEQLGNLCESDIRVFARIAYVFEVSIQKIKSKSCLRIQVRNRIGIIRKCLQDAQMGILNGRISSTSKKQLSNSTMKWDRLLPELYRHLGFPSRDPQNMVTRITRIQNATSLFVDKQDEAEGESDSQFISYPKDISMPFEKGESRVKQHDFKDKPLCLSPNKKSAAVLVQLLRKGEL